MTNEKGFVQKRAHPPVPKKPSLKRFSLQDHKPLTLLNNNTSDDNPVGDVLSKRILWESRMNSALKNSIRDLYTRPKVKPKPNARPVPKPRSTSPQPPVIPEKHFSHETPVECLYVNQPMPKKRDSLKRPEPLPRKTKAHNRHHSCDISDYETLVRHIEEPNTYDAIVKEPEYAVLDPDYQELPRLNHARSEPSLASLSQSEFSVYSDVYDDGLWNSEPAHPTPISSPTYDVIHDSVYECVEDEPLHQSMSDLCLRQRDSLQDDDYLELDLDNHHDLIKQSFEESGVGIESDPIYLDLIG